jgi:hypothetical protein
MVSSSMRTWVAVRVTVFNKPRGTFGADGEVD